MKNKIFPNKLKLNKETISKLDQNEILGGATAACSYPCPDPSDYSYDVTCVNYTCG